MPLTDSLGTRPVAAARRALPTADDVVAHTLLNCLLRELSGPEYRTAVDGGTCCCACRAEAYCCASPCAVRRCWARTGSPGRCRSGGTGTEAEAGTRTGTETGRRSTESGRRSTESGRRPTETGRRSAGGASPSTSEASCRSVPGCATTSSWTRSPPATGPSRPRSPYARHGRSPSPVLPSPSPSPIPPTRWRSPSPPTSARSSPSCSATGSTPVRRPTPATRAPGCRTPPKQARPSPCAISRYAST